MAMPPGPAPRHPLNLPPEVRSVLYQHLDPADVARMRLVERGVAAELTPDVRGYSQLLHEVRTNEAEAHGFRVDQAGRVDRTGLDREDRSAINRIFRLRNQQERKVNRMRQKPPPATPMSRFVAGGILDRADAKLADLKQRNPYR
jgi:hypothetical protein